jgi:hypothetical protein
MRPAQRLRTIDDEPSQLANTTYTYNDALLNGRMTRAELEAVRAELLGGSGEYARTEQVPAPGVDLAEVKAKIDAGDYAGALDLAERAVHEAPDNVAAKRYADIARKSLCRLYQATLGARADTLHLAVPEAQIPNLPLDRWAAFVVSLIDGRSTIDDVIEASSLGRLDGLRILYALVHQGVVFVGRSG